MKNFIIFYLLVILLNLILPIDDIISFKIESFQYNGEHTNSQIINQLYDSNLVTTVKIGSYSYPLKTFVDAKNHYFFISIITDIGLILLKILLHLIYLFHKVHMLVLQMKNLNFIK